MIFHGLMIKVKMFLEDDIDALVRSIMMAHSVFCRL